MRDLIRGLVPPSLLTWSRRLRRREHMCYGNYVTFADARAHAHGWDDPAAVAASVSAMQERLGSQPYLTPEATRLAAALFKSLAGRDLTAGTLRVLDFGGGLGLHYFQAMPLLPTSLDVEWTVWETALLATAGSQRHGCSDLKFIASLEQAREVCPAPDVIVASGALDYVEDPWAAFDQLSQFETPAIIIDRMTLLGRTRSRGHRIRPERAAQG